MNKSQPSTAPSLPPQDGILLIDKPADWTSHDVVAKVRKLCQTRRVGHTGTLDPFATGVLVICLNRATRLVQFLTGADKEYLATIRFGFATDTGDFTGQPITDAVSATHLTAQIINEALPQFRGQLQQIPPMYSAKKIGGVKLYEMARRGEEVIRKPIQITIKELALLAPPPTPLPPDCFMIRVVCSAGTYIRTLAEDIGKSLGIGAHLVALRRTRVDDFALRQAVSLEQLAATMATGQLSDLLMPMTAALNFPTLHLAELQRQFLQHGRPLQYQGAEDDGAHMQLLYQNELVGLATYDKACQLLRPHTVFL